MVRYRSERSNCVVLRSGLEDFCTFIDSCKLVDLPLVGRKFTWYGPDKKKSRLNRFLVDETWLKHYEDIRQTGLKRSMSDHIPILLANEVVDWGPKPFKIFNVWLFREDCSRLIYKEWTATANKKGRMWSKLRRLKGVIKKWNEEVGNVMEKRVVDIEERMKVLDASSDHPDLIAEELEEMKILNLEFMEAMKFKEGVGGRSQE